MINIIDAFGKDFSEGEGTLSGRWLPEVSSYGAYFPAPYLEKEVQSSYQIKCFFEQVEQQDYIERAESYYLDKAAMAFPELENNQLEAICEHLHKRLERFQSKLFKMEKSWRDLKTARNVVGDDPDHTITKLSTNIQLMEDKVAKVSNDLNQWLNYFAQESIWLYLFSWLPAVRKKRRLKRRLYVENKLSSDSINLVSNVEYGKIEQKLTDWQSEQQKKLQSWHREINNKQQLINELREFESQWTSISSDLVEDSIQLPNLDVCDKVADTKIRFKMFRLAVHYWEGRWLRSCKELGNEIESHQKKTGPKVVESRWRRRMMLTPCIVSTFHALPSHMTCTPYIEGSYDEEHLFNFIDLLIVDEAGQVSPEVAGASFSLAKKALVIGDIHQIEPVRTLTSAIDIGNLSGHNIIKNDEEYEQVLQTGRSVVNGNAMLIAQSASLYHYKEEMEPGMFLLEHWRCYDEIISFCNDLCYKNALIAKRGCADDKSVYPPFGYLHIDGYAEQRSGGSRFNQLEAETIAAWLNENRKELELTFDAPLEVIVGIITPFKAQVYKIQQACNKYGIKTGKKPGELIIGTIHALQGAERNLVIFSPVYSRHNNGGFIDRTSSMLNVAVSRAKDSFMVFGDIDVISAAPSSQPRGLLAKYLFSDKNNELVFSLQERSDLLLQCGKPRLINNAEQHDAYLFELLSQVENNVYIVSPWVQLNKLKQTRLLEALMAAYHRNVIINLYTDHHFNT